jgi:hypothetical protein
MSYLKERPEKYPVHHVGLLAVCPWGEHALLVDMLYITEHMASFYSFLALDVGNKSACLSPIVHKEVGYSSLPLHAAS